MPVTEKDNPDLLDSIETGKPEKPNKKQKDKKKKKGGFPFIPVLILLIIIGSIVALLVFDLFGFRERYIFSYLRNAPLIGPLIPAPETDPESVPEGRYAGTSHEELVSIITALEIQIETQESDIITAREQNTMLQDTISYLRGFEAQIEEYRQIKEQFDRMVVEGDSNGYKEFFESISPENAERLYKEAVIDTQYSDSFRKYAATVMAMSPDAAANALAGMLTADTDLVVRILTSIDRDSRAAIMDEMETAVASRVMRFLEPQKPEIVPTAPPLTINAPETNAYDMEDQEEIDEAVPLEPVDIEDGADTEVETE